MSEPFLEEHGNSLSKGSMIMSDKKVHDEGSIRYANGSMGIIFTVVLLVVVIDTIITLLT